MHRDTISPLLTGGLVHQDGTAVYMLDGDLDAGAADALREQISRLIAESPGEVALDLSRVGFLDAAGLRALEALSAIAQEGGGRLVLLAPHARVRRVMEVLRVEDRFAIREGDPR